MTTKVKTHNFKAQTHKVLNILTHSLYTNREIFLRELLSNASDALDKLRFLENKGESISHTDLPKEIRVTTDKDKGLILIHDTGVGMSLADMEDNLGTIAKSGSEEFLKDVDGEKEVKDIDPYAQEDIVETDTTPSDASQIIGRFGIGFYSVFMVADSVEVLSVPAYDTMRKKGDSKGYLWKSEGSETYTVTELEDTSDLPRGTLIRIKLKANAKEYLEDFRLESIIRSHSNFLPFPIYLNDTLINTTPALWREPKFNIKPEQYDEFYSFLTYDGDKPFDVMHLNVDAPVQFNALMFIPEKSEDHFGEKDTWGLDLYVRRVLIEKKHQDIIPNYLAFLKGVVDIEDLPLNISRETLQENLVIRKISQTIVRQVISHLERMATNNKEKYLQFFENHGKYFKFAFNDYIYRDRVLPLMRYISSASEELMSLDDYISRMKSEQKEIWYVSASSKEAARLNPHMERFNRKGIEVLFLLDAVDEIALDSMNKYKEFAFKNIEQADGEALNSFADTQDAKDKLPKMNSEEETSFQDMLQSMKSILGDIVKDVRSTDRLTGSPACMASADGMSSSMEKIMRSMQKSDGVPQKVLELNPDHALIRSMLAIYNDDKDSTLFQDMAHSVFDNTIMLDGYLNDPYIMAERSLKLMEKASAWYLDLRKK